MLKRPAPTLSDRFAATVEKFVRILVSARSAGRPVSGPVVFRHYL